MIEIYKKELKELKERMEKSEKYVNPFRYRGCLWY